MKLDDQELLLDNDETGGGAKIRFEHELAIVAGWGEWDLATVPELRAILEEALRADMALIVDMSQVTYVDSSGFNVLLESSRLAHSLGLTMFLAACNTNITRILEVTRLDRVFEIVSTVEDARSAARRLSSSPA